MFNAIHIWYLLISLAVTVLVVAALFILKNDRLHRAAIWFFAIATLVIHFSGMWHELFTNGAIISYNNYAFPIFPCHICMWLLVISATVLDKKGLPARLLRDFTFLGGTVCGVVGVVFNFNFDASPTLTDYYVLKGMLSHSTMIIGCILLFVAGYAEISLRRTVSSTVVGVGIFLADGLAVNALFLKHGFGEINAMYLQYPPFAEAPFINAYTIFGGAIFASAVIALVYEFLLRALKRPKKDAADAENAPDKCVE